MGVDILVFVNFQICDGFVRLGPSNQGRLKVINRCMYHDVSTYWIRTCVGKYFYCIIGAIFFSIVQHGLGVETERVPRVETEGAMLGPLLGQGVETEREHAKNVTGVVHVSWQPQHF